MLLAASLLLPLVVLSYELSKDELMPLHLTSGQSHMPRIGFGTAAIQVQRNLPLPHP